MRADRRIASYYEKIRNVKQEKPFYELVLQIGDKEWSQWVQSEKESLAAVMGGTALDGSLTLHQNTSWQSLWRKS